MMLSNQQKLSRSPVATSQPSESDTVGRRDRKGNNSFGYYGLQVTSDRATSDPCSATDTRLAARRRLIKTRLKIHENEEEQQHSLSALCQADPAKLRSPKRDGKSSIISHEQKLLSQDIFITSYIRLQRNSQLKLKRKRELSLNIDIAVNSPKE